MNRELLEAINQFIIDQSNLGFSKADVLLEEIERELEKPELDYRRVLKEINEFIKADILPEEIKAELAKPNEPVGYVLLSGHGDSFRREISNDLKPFWKPVWLHPPSQQKPLSDDEIDNIKYYSIPSDFDRSLRRFAREVEKAHGITS